MNGDLAFGGAGLVLAVVYYMLAAAIPESQLADAVGPQGLPRIYAVVLAVLSVILIGRSLRGRSEKSAPLTAAKVLRASGTVGLGIAYIVVVPYAGYVVALTGLIAATTYYQSNFRLKPEATWRPIVVAVAGAAIFWILFVKILGIQHPAGIWPDLF